MVLSSIVISIFMMVPAMCFVMATVNVMRIRYFSDYVSDVIAYYFSNDDLDYLYKTKMEFFSFDKPKINVDVGPTFANFNTGKFWDWDFKSKIVEEKKK